MTSGEIVSGILECWEMWIGFVTKTERAYSRNGTVAFLGGADDGIDVVTAATILSEAGWDMSKWEDEDHFVSWLRLCPDNRISGNKVLGKGRLPTNNRASIALRMAASTLRVSNTYLGAQFRRFRTKLGPPVAIKAMVAAAKKLAGRLPLLSSNDLRDLLTSFLQSVIIQENNIQVMIRRRDLRELLEKGDHIDAVNLGGLREPIEPAELICLTIEAIRKQYGGEVRGGSPQLERTGPTS